MIPDWARARCEDGTAYWVDRIDKDVARDLIVPNHYSHTWGSAFGAHNFGVFDGEGLAGALVFGNPMNPGSYGSLADLPPDAVTELNRMWIDDRLGPNTETACLSRAMRWLRHHSSVQLIQTFADGRLGCGTVYKAANFGYYGASETLFFEDRESGAVLHGTRFSNTNRSRGMVMHNARLSRGDLRAFYVKTYRYLYPLTKYARRRIIPERQPYPKCAKGARYVDDYVAPLTQMARASLMAGALGYATHAADIDAYLAVNYTPADVARAKAEMADNEFVAPLLAESLAQPDLFGGDVA